MKKSIDDGMERRWTPGCISTANIRVKLGFEEPSFEIEFFSPDLSFLLKICAVHFGSWRD